MKQINTTQIIERDEAFRYFERLMRRGTIRLRTPASAEQTAQSMKQTAQPTSQTAYPTNMTAREQVVYEHYTLVISIAAEYQHQGLEIMDLIMAGMTGLMMAYDKYDAEQKTDFANYAGWWIRGEVCRELNACGHPIRQNWRTRKDINRILSEQERFMLSQGRQPTAEELSELTGICPTKVMLLLTSSLPFEPYGEEANE